MKKILLVWPYFLPDPGAAASRGAAFKKYLGEDYHVEVVTKHNDKTTYPESKEITRLNLQISLIPWKFFPSLFQMFLSVRSVNPDIIIASSPNIILSFYAFIASKLLKINFYLDVRDLAIHGRGLKGKVLNFFDRLQHKGAKKVFVTTGLQKEQTLTNFNLENNKVIVVNNGVDLDKFALDKNNTREYDLVFAGSINPERNPNAIVRLLDNLYERNSKLKILFFDIDKNNPTTKNFVNEIKKRKYINNVTFVPESEEEESFKYTNSAKLGLVTLAENFNLDYMMPVKVYAYMASGAIPVGYIPARSTTLWSFFETTHCGIYSDKLELIADKIIELLKDSANQIKLRNQNFEIIKTYDRKKIIRDLKKHIV